MFALEEVLGVEQCGGGTDNSVDITLHKVMVVGLGRGNLVVMTVFFQIFAHITIL